MIAKITFNDKSSDDLGLILTTFEPQPPTPNIIKIPVPYMNGSYDFSRLYGEQTYSERTILCKLQLVTKSRSMLYAKYSEVLEWLLESGKSKLIYSDEAGLYYTARVETPPSWEMVKTTGIFDFEFIAYPFKYGKNLEGTDIWDTFNFETDTLQTNTFNIIVTKTIELQNYSAIKIVPSIICSTAMAVIKSGITYSFPTGTSKNFGFMLGKGLNSLIINGTGNIKFEWQREVF